MIESNDQEKEWYEKLINEEFDRGELTMSQIIPLIVAEAERRMIEKVEKLILLPQGDSAPTDWLISAKELLSKLQDLKKKV